MYATTPEQGTKAALIMRRPLPVPSQYVELLRKCGLTTQLRAAHERMAALFPLSEQLWMEWVNDELAQVSAGQKEVQIGLRHGYGSFSPHLDRVS
jgi:hypothetical protein